MFRLFFPGPTTYFMLFAGPLVAQTTLQLSDEVLTMLNVPLCWDALYYGSWSGGEGGGPSRLRLTKDGGGGLPKDVTDRMNSAFILSPDIWAWNSSEASTSTDLVASTATVSYHHCLHLHQHYHHHHHVSCFSRKGGGLKHPVCMVINFKRIASPENYHRQPHSIYKSLSGRLEACICRWRWECGYLSGQPFLHLKKLCAKECYHGLPFDSKPTSYSAKVLWKNSIKQSCHKMNKCYYFKL